MDDVQKIELYENVITSLFSKLKEQDNSFLREKDNTNTTEKAMSLLDWANKEENFVFDNVYAYIFQDLKSVYIGRTTNLIARDKQHRTDKDSAVFKFSQTNSVEIPIMTILERNVSLEDGIKMESFYCSVAKKKGWNLINIAKTGIPVSAGKPKSRWDFEKCYNEAIKYSNVGDFKKNTPSAYEKSIRNGYLRDFHWLKGRVLNVKRVRTYDECVEIARKYNSLKSFYKNERRIYRYSTERGWISDFTWLKKEKEHKKKIAQYTQDGVLLNVFDSINEASKATNISYNGIYNCYKGKTNEYKGYVWKPVI